MKFDTRTACRLFALVRPHLKAFIIGLFAMVVTAAVNLALPYLFGKGLIDNVLTTRDFTLLNLVALGIIVLFIIKGGFVYTTNYLLAYVGQRAVLDLRERIFRHLQRLPLSFFARRKAGDLISHMTYDTTMIENSISKDFANLIQQIFAAVFTLVVIFVIHWKLSLLTLVVFPFMGWVFAVFSSKIRKVARKRQEKFGELTSVMEESIYGIRIIKAFNLAPVSQDRFEAENLSNFEKGMKTEQVRATMVPIIELLLVVGLSIVLWFGGSEVIKGNLTAGELMAFIGYIAMLSNPVLSISRTIATLQQAFAAGDRIFALLDEDITVEDKPDAVELGEIEGRVRFENVSFQYPGEDKRVLERINLDVAPGEIVALVGPSGAGKTTLVNLIPRFYDPTEGAIYLDEIDIRDVKQDSLREKIGLVPQETILFGVSVRENIRYGRLDATDEEIEYAAKLANAHDFIMELSEGYDTILGEKGQGLSGGQRQRLAIARAVLRNPKILILDEATSALDTESERLVQDALDRLMANRTTFVIAHRLSTIVNADRIVVLQDGRIVETGTHQELLEAGGLYHKLYQMQFSRGR
ncbi:MAG: ABC transporter ATP-binding protein [Firmicutes bacterium]|nr:ABC transporter ATP-binding protein [Bacillota bacterium]